MTAATTAAVPSAAAPLDRRAILVIFGGLMLVMLLAALDSTIVATALPRIVSELGGLEHLSWVVTAYLLAQTIVTPLYGKLGDLYGRKIVLQVATVIFLVGSALCGLSREMWQLILFRAVQGLGGGGLAVTTQAVVGDIIPPRERGRYQGIFGAAFGVASIAGPLLGGFFTTQLSWRWIFYINLPLGALALAVIATTLPERATRVRHRIDYLGAALLAIVLSAITLIADLGGTAYPWSSPPMLALMVAAPIALLLFVRVEQRASEPVLPLRLFANRDFTIASILGLIVGFALFGSVTYVPLFLQVVKGASPTASGLLMVPQMGGMLTTSILSGQLISRTGRYKVFPIIGTTVMTIGLFMLSRMTAQTSMMQVLLTMLVIGMGLGCVMQVLVIAVQNAVDYRDLGVATSGATLFRLIGGSFGTAVLGAIFASRLHAHLAAMLPGAAAAVGSAVNVETLSRLPPALRAAYIEAFSASLGTVFLVGTVVVLLGLAFALMLPERPLRESVAASASSIGEEIGETGAMPRDDDPLRPLLRGLTILADRDVQRRHIERIVQRAGVGLSPLAAWLLVQVDRDHEPDLAALAHATRLEHARLEGALDELRREELIATPADRRAPITLTPRGCETLGRLVEARRKHLAELFAEWAPERHEDLAQVLRRFARDLVPDAPAPRVAADVAHGGRRVT